LGALLLGNKGAALAAPDKPESYEGVDRLREETIVAGGQRSPRFRVAKSWG
jgi:hypothetical protein